MRLLCICQFLGIRDCSRGMFKALKKMGYVHKKNECFILALFSVSEYLLIPFGECISLK